ncbi:MAG: aldo/keto reductase [Deltaproteobacteria bacterium]|jgi:aryl-alcohol dehydrogenase-like predicted oxidoreductase/NAD-dependent dihydropyrimidine dehydrogenase PreA subunit|nr:aldo/keto reductase [Deltaproteobacteria bacterium]
MRRLLLGKSGIEVSELCFGALPMGPLQKDLDMESGSAVIARALEGGVNFIDTAQLYRTYSLIRAALERVDRRPVIASKSTAADYDGMRRAVDEALEALGVGRLDIFHLHAARADVDVFERRRGAWQCLLDCRAAGLIRAVGISTHTVPVVERAAAMAEVDVVFPLLNFQGTGILQGTVATMIAAIRRCLAAGKGVYLMKVLGGGCLVGEYHRAFAYVRRLFPDVPLAVGMVSEAEVDYNLAYFTASEAERAAMPPLPAAAKRFQVVAVVCQRCGTCVGACPNGAISQAAADQVPVIDPQLCLRCGYCVGECPEFAIRMV